MTAGSALTVLLTTEGTYPFGSGGVSTWCDALIRSTPDTRYVLLPLTMNPHVELKFAPPPNVKKMVRVPLWGTEEPGEFITDIPFSTLYERKHATTGEAIERGFLPPFRRFVTAVFAETTDCAAIGASLVAMEDYLDDYDYNVTMKSPAVWREFSALATAAGLEISRSHPAGARCVATLFDVTECLRWLYHFLMVLNVRAPRTSLTHSTAAAFCGIPCITAKLRHGTPMMLTEHGVYIREQNLAIARMRESFFGRNFLLSLVTAIARTNYWFADVISPVCEYNTRWELAHGAASDRIRVIYNGVDVDRFSPGPRPPGAPHVVATARIDPLKDTETFLRVAAAVRTTHPDVKFSIFGAVSDPGYYERCLRLRSELSLEDAVEMGAPTGDVVAAYRSADVVLLTSISEAFPYSVIEAMSCERPVVASDVGGVNEALAGCGIVVRPRDVDGFAAAVRRLLDDEALRARDGRASREKVIERFRLDRNIDAYLDVYRELARESAA